MKISDRLKMIASFVDDNSYIIDVGCDHALLDVYLVQTKLNIRAIASDVNEKPLQFAYANIKKYNLLDNIKISLSDGINDINEDVDTIVISGMGTSNIINILFNHKDKLNNVKRIIISSNNDYYLLRKTFVNNNYFIKDEDIVFENDKFYQVIVFEKGNVKYKDFDLKYGPILTRKKSSVYLKYISLVIDKLNKINSNLSIKYLKKKLVIKKEIRKLKRI